MPRKGERKRSLFGAGNAGRFPKGAPLTKRAHIGGHADDAEEAVAEEPVAEAVPPTPVAPQTEARKKEKSPSLVSPPLIARSFPTAATPRPFNTARSVSSVQARDANWNPACCLFGCSIFAEVRCATYIGFPFLFAALL